MKYPLNRPSKPISSKLAKELSESIETGKAVTNPDALATFQQIIEEFFLKPHAKKTTSKVR